MEGDDHRNTGCETFDDRQRHVFHRAASAGECQQEQHEPRQHANDEHPIGTMVGHDGDEHHGHCAGRAAYLDVATAEDCGQDARDDGRRNSSCRADTRSNVEVERQGECD